jgi:Ca2+-transporting ATPase
MRQGRIVYSNLRRFVVYLMSCNFSEILVVGLGIALGLPTLLTPLQILFLNLVTDVFPAFALGLGEGNPNAMAEKPRNPSESIVDRRRWIEVVLFGTVIALATFVAFAGCYFNLSKPVEECRTAAFLTLALAQLWHVFNMRGFDERFLANSITKNIYIWIALAICLVLLSTVVLEPRFALVLKLSLPGTDTFLLVVAASLLPVAVGKFWLMFLKGLEKKNQTLAV